MIPRCHCEEEAALPVPSNPFSAVSGTLWEVRKMTASCSLATPPHSVSGWDTQAYTKASTTASGSGLLPGQGSRMPARKKGTGR